jgi:hypothetical protein
MFLCFN